jgi:ABC-2 type transport system ATP-binding protein
MPSTVESPPPVLEATELRYGYGGGFRLDGVSFRVEAGSFTALLGPNGAGKTTLFSLLTRLFDSAGGAIRICGRDLRAEPRVALATVGIVFQQPTLDLDLSVQQNLRYFAALHGLSGRQADARITAELERLALLDSRRARARTLSGGLRRRVEMARALLHRPSLLLLDEPTVGLDIPTRLRLVEHVHALARDPRIGVLWATHLIDEVGCDDRVIMLHRGRIVASGSVRAVVCDAGCNSLGEAFARLCADPLADPLCADESGGTPS